MDKSKNEVIERVAEKYTKLPSDESKARIEGIMEGYLIAKEEEKRKTA
jgi:hypothetical protein